METERAFQSLGKINYGIIAAEEKGKQFKRSIYISRDMIEGEEFTEENLRIIRPGFGLEPKYFERILGKKIRKSVVQGTPLTWDLL